MNSKSALRLFSTLFVVALLSVLLIGCAGETGPGAEPEDGDENGAETGGVLDKQYNPKLASAEVDGDFMTVWAENYADHMREWSDGMCDVEVFGYGTLGSSRTLSNRRKLVLSNMYTATTAG